MARVDEPNINVGKKTNEGNISAVKSWAGNVTDAINYHEQVLNEILTRLNALESEDE